MDFTEKRHVQSPELKANPISRFLFLWITPLFTKGRKKTLSIDDLYDRLPDDDASTLGDKMQRLWNEECVRAKKFDQKPRFLRCCIRFFRAKFFWLFLFVLINECILKLSQPFILRNLIRSFTSEDTLGNENLDIQNQQYFYTGALLVVTFFYSINIHHIYMGLIHLAMKGRIACNSIIYRKIFRISKTVQSDKVSIGKLVNLIASDSNRFEHAFIHLSSLIAGPIQLLVMSYFLYDLLGPACFLGLGIIGGVLIPFQIVVGRLSIKYRTMVAARTDERGRMLNEILMGIRIIKMYAWEIPFSAIIHQLRKREILPVRKASYLRGTFQSLNSLGKTMIPLCTFILYVSLGNELTADKAYFTIAVYSIIIPAMAQKIPVAVAQTAEILVAMRRIEEFLLLEELQIQGRESTIEDVKKSPPSLISTNQNGCEKLHVTTPHLILDTVSANWTNERVTLQEISMNVSGSQLVMVVGPVGCGKSSLLNLIISELKILSGSMSIKGKLSFACQETWIFSGNILQNILFGSLYEMNRYDNVVRVCGLEDDLKQLPHGDKTIVGERGVTLSVGQKARVSLARAIYRKADIYLLDDPLSAVDTRVSRHIFEKCIKQQLAGSLRILVTHQLQYLPQADHIIVFNEHGKIAAQGTYQEILAQKVDFIMDSGRNDVQADEINRNCANVLPSSGIISNTTIKEHAVKDDSISKNDPRESFEEKKLTGSVTWKTYFTYITSGNSKTELIIVVFLFLSSQAVISFTDKWLAIWTNQVSRRSMNTTLSTDDEAEHSDAIFITVYSACVPTVMILVTMKAIVFFHYSMSIGVKLHSVMFSALVRAPVRFFDTNSSGKILNRFTRDVNCVDEQLPPSLHDCLNILLYFVGIMVVVVSTNLYLIAPCAILMLVLWGIRRFYMETARSIKRLESITKSPIFLHLSASVQGLCTIRGLEAEQVVVDQFDAYLDINTSPAYLVPIGNRWMGCCMDVMCLLYLACVAANFMIFSSVSEGGNIGMSITLTLNLLTITQWGMRQSAEVENMMTYVERILEYCNIIPEAALDSKDAPPKHWPSDGAIKFSNVSMSYDETTTGSQVLKNLNFEIRGNEKIGIVGRTGAGKSSIIAALFRLTESQGSIFIDRVSTKTLGLHDLRRSISIIPQDPVLFCSTIRYNLDPFNEFSDTELWQVLKEVNLADAVPSIDFKVSDGGGNFSVGQRQLVCLARAILRKNKIIVLDEATANVDYNTDAFVQQTIRKKFADCTIITIAHRLNSVIDNDRILVMDNGCIAEFDTPANLLRNPDSLFALMVNQSGAVTEIGKIITG